MTIKDIYKTFKKYNSICTDTRKIKKDDIYFALTGENFNGNSFAEQALSKGASFAVIDDYTLKNKNERFIYVENTLDCLQQLANYHRQQLKFPIIALTGSNGKTTTKELINAVLTSKYNVKATKGNLNNHIGVPLTLLEFNNELDFGIVEMGANHQKEIEQLCKIAEPDFGLITNFGKAHLEGFGGVEGVIKGKSELYTFLKNNNKTAFINIDDQKQIEQIGDYRKIITYGQQDQADCQVKLVSANPYVKFKTENQIIESQLVGNYNFGNIAVAVAIANHFEVSSIQIKSAIEKYVPDNNRSEIKFLKTNKIILDAYNANPNSMMAALQNFLKLKTDTKFLFLGDMFELGEDSAKEHQAIVNFTESNFKNNIYFVGENFYKTQTSNSSRKFRAFNDLKHYLEEQSIENATILIKGSRGMALERIIDYL